MRSWDSSAGTVTKLQADNPGFESLQEYKLRLLQNAQTTSWAHPTSYSMGGGGSFPGSRAAAV